MNNLKAHHSSLFTFSIANFPSWFKWLVHIIRCRPFRNYTTFTPSGPDWLGDKSIMYLPKMGLTICGLEIPEHLHRLFWIRTLLGPSSRLWPFPLTVSYKVFPWHFLWSLRLCRGISLWCGTCFEWFARFLCLLFVGATKSLSDIRVFMNVCH